jgi:PIN domain nuclease of toxin-antitoxin system
VTLLDAQALIALIMGEAAMERVSEILREGEAAMTAPNVAEVFDVSVRRYGLSHARVAEKVDPLFEGPIASIAVDVELARRAAALRGEHYHRADCPLSLADSILLAAAKPDDKIATADGDVLAVASKLGIETIELPRNR